MKILLICIIILLLVFLIIKNPFYIEHFDKDYSQKYILTDNKYNVSDSVNLNKNEFHKMLVSFKKTGKLTSSYHGDITLYIDPYINYYVLNNDDKLPDYDDGIFICLTPNKLGILDTIWKFENKTIAYNYLSDYLFIQAIIKGYRLDESKIKLIKINNDDLHNVDIKFDYFITYVVINSEYMKFLETSHFYINGLVDVDINRILPFYPFVRANLKNVRDYFKKIEMKEYINPKENVNIPLMNLKKFKLTETFITRLQQNIDYVDKNYGCYGDIDVYNKYACNSQYNILGQPKGYYSIWDKKCTQDTDCPYFKSNTNYPNNRGGCIDGSCEFPSGMNKLGFAKHDSIDYNPPFCYGCNDVNCCKTQKNPDYVFPNDYSDRRKYNKSTIISQLDYESY